MTRILPKSTLPFLGLASLVVFWTTQIRNLFNDHDKSVDDEDIAVPSSSVIRLIFLVVATCGMEYVARYEHQYIWHSRYLWFFHASHHHQRTTFGSGPSKNDAESNSFTSGKDNSFELNDIFAAVFSISAIIILYWSYDPLEPRLIHDIAFGVSSGISVYGTSYFIGHDLCAHERGGSDLANYLRKMSPWMAKCADVHMKYHHKIDVDADSDDDPYGTPYGFWLGPQEILVVSE